MRNIRVAERSAWVTSIPADGAHGGAAAPTPTKRPRRRLWVLMALVFAVALVGVPVVVMDGTGTVNASDYCLRIKDGQFNAPGRDADNLNGEWVRVKNTCAYSASLKGWKLRDVRGHTFRFPAVKLAADAVVKVHTGKGTAEAGHLYWKRSRPVWNNKAYERAYLISPTGLRVSTWPKTPPPSGDAWSVPFLSRPTSGPIRMAGGCDNLVIENKTFKDLGPDVEAIHLERCDNVTIRANDFARVAQAITVLDSTNVRIEWNRYQDIVGPHERVGKNRANFAQLVRVTRGYIGHNKGKGGDTEDIVSLYKSGGTSASPFIVEFNHFEGTNWTSSSGSGIALGDESSGYSIARNNTLLNVGQVGMFIASGTNHKILDNVIYGERRTSSNVGLYVWNQYPTACSGHEVRGNRVKWLNASGASNPSWDGGNCGTISDWTSNDWNATLDPATLRVSL